jgi:tetratricopeptide (TPR) repeat protein
MKPFWLCCIVVFFVLFSCKNRPKTNEAMIDSLPQFQQILSNNNSSTDSLIYVATQATEDSLRVEAYNKLFFKTVYSDTVLAQQYVDALFELGKTNAYAQARAYNLQGIRYDVKGDYETALASYNQAITEAKDRFYNVEGSAYNNIGLIYWNRGNYLDALTYYNQALELFQYINYKKHEADALSNIGLIYKDLEDFEKANDFYNKSLSIRRFLNDEYGISVSLTNLGQSYERQGNYTTALELYDTAINIKRKLNDELGLSNTLYNLADIHLHLNNIDTALTLLQQAEQLCVKNGAESNNLTNIYVSLADVYVKLGNAIELKRIIDKLFLLVNKRQDERNLINYFNLCTKYYELLNDYKMALSYKRKADSIYSKLEGIEAKNAIIHYETKYKTAQKETDLANAQLKITEEKLKSKQKSTWLK